MDLEKRIAALEIAVQELLEKENRRLRYIDGVLCERKPYSREWTPVEPNMKLDLRRFEAVTSDPVLLRELYAVLYKANLSRRELAVISMYLRVRPGFSLADFDT